MTRTTDPEPLPAPPLGERIVRPGERPAPDAAWKPKPGAPGIEENARTGRIRTNLPLPK